MPDTHHLVAGWDIGGAHIKLAFIDEQKIYVHQWDCPLWKGVDELLKVLQIALTTIPNSIANHHVTMTGELVDVFTTHQQGVEVIVNMFMSLIDKQKDVRFYSSKGLLDYQQTLDDPLSVASVNWIASAEAVSQKQSNVLFLDIGSTTSDILLINENGLVINGLSDYERLISGELVYTGVVRSCVNSICQEIPFNKNWVPLMAELFATSADVYRILALLPEHADYGATMDGEAKDKVSSMRRLARMIGKDYNPADDKNWLQACEYICGEQMLMIESKILPVLRNNPSVDTIVGAGVGSFLVRIIAERLFLHYKDFSQCIIPQGLDYQSYTSDCAPAVALVFINTTKQ